MKNKKPLRILHFSDIHVDMLIRHIKWRKLFSKRAVGAMNLLRGRSKYFDNVEQKMEALVEFKEKNNIDIVINSGDYTALGLEDELKIAKELVYPLMQPPQRYITVPGNHDIYVHEGNSHYRFSEQFCSVLQNDLPEYCSGGHWPLVRLVGDDLAIVAINSARPNILPWKSNGMIPTEQLESLDKLLKDDRVKDRTIIIVTHYAPKLSNGENDTKLHGLSNSSEFLKTCSNIESGAIVCGHIHKAYRVYPKEINIPIYCAGSSTMESRENAWIYEVENKRIKAYPIRWNGKEYYTLSPLD
ncbi:metallophosphoesterase [hydrothermal vent metagenome]|uniref:Metallophosphoesterase n=1 Tax=hydrothermal vent metagenome TaxID=652676 RepID=A0A1W1C8M6_9ZZZZ